MHAATLLMIALFLGRWAALIPMAVLGAILLVVAYNMSEWRAFVNMLRAPKSDVAVLATTFLLTVVIDLTVAIEVGIVLAAFLFMRRMAEVTNVSVVDARVHRERGRRTTRTPRARAHIPHGRARVRDQRSVLLRRRGDVQGHDRPHDRDGRAC